MGKTYFQRSEIHLLIGDLRRGIHQAGGDLV
eukprot:CAMPEP_0119465766 /NCGR_PEP_ID=MMETSP1344-20130328/741_1 /TAXON_ID=236787 /ORGANISM="Florenciella parvula, Strain CCMP2471" /LENGTH=30 /DNA_ID= /DNA_START= /DNA_END= /DNA_ORIENTATION=